MSLFDVIRYPVNDIFCDEINSYPPEIMIPWLKYCYDLAGLGEHCTDVSKWRSFSTAVHILVVRADLYLFDGGDGELPGEKLKECFTLDLQRRIRDHA